MKRRSLMEGELVHKQLHAEDGARSLQRLGPALDGLPDKQVPVTARVTERSFESACESGSTRPCKAVSVSIP